MKRSSPSLRRPYLDEPMLANTDLTAFSDGLRSNPENNKIQSSCGINHLSIEQ
jgi:hypothetical protein